MDSGLWAILFTLIILIVLSGFFSSTETAYSSINKIRVLGMANDGNKKAKGVLKILSKYDRFLSTVLVGNNIVNITSASLATVFFTSLIKNNEDVAITLSTVVMTIVVLIFGEILPKLIARNKPEGMALAFYPIIRFFIIILFPITIVFSGLQRLVVKIFKFEHRALVTEDELITIVQSAENEGEIESHESELIRSAIEFEDLDVRDIMVPRVNVIAVNENASMEKIYNKFTTNGFSRLPVYRESIDHIVGIIHEKDFYRCLHDDVKNIKNIIQATVCVSSTMKISTVLRMLQRNKVHMAIVVDEFGGTEGIVTLEDILEELVGEIYDEHDEVEQSFTKVDDTTYIVNGAENLEDILETMGVDSEPDADTTTVGGFVTEQMDKIPDVGEKFEYENLVFEVTKGDKTKVEEVKISILPKVEEEE